MEPIADEFRKRMSDKPDDWTLAWWKERFAEVLKSYRGATGAINRAMADLEDSAKSMGEMRREFDVLKSQIRGEVDSAKSRLGELVAEVAELTVRVERMADFLNANRKKKE